MTRRRITGLVLAALVALPWVVGGEYSSIGDHERRRIPGRFVRLKDGFTRCELQGPARGEVVVLVHGISSFSFVWGDLPEALQRAGYRTLTYDLYGRGWSDRPWERYDLDLFDRQLESLIRKLKLRRRVHVVGLSMGGLIATEYALRHGDRTASVTLVDPAGFGVEAPPGAALLRMPLVGDWLMQLAGGPLLLAGQARSLHDQSLVAAFEEKYRPQQSYAGFKRAVLSSLRHMPLEDFSARYADLASAALPTLLFWGSEDRVTPIAGADRALGILPQARLVRVEGAGHLPHYEKTAEVAGPLVEFLAENAAGPGRHSRRERRLVREQRREDKEAKAETERRLRRLQKEKGRERREGAGGPGRSRR